MPKTIDYPRTSYLSAWEVSEVVDDTGGKCSIEACARKLNRKVSGSFKAILGSAVKFGLLTSKREMLTTTNLFRRIKNAYDKEEEKIYHREAFLHPPLFAHICRKFRNRELPVHMLDVMLVREFDVEEINAQNVAKAFVEGARMVDVLDERNFVADIDQLTKVVPRRGLANPEMDLNLFRADAALQAAAAPATVPSAKPLMLAPVPSSAAALNNAPVSTDDAVANLFGLDQAGSAPNQPAPPAHHATGHFPPPAALTPSAPAVVPTPIPSDSTPNGLTTAVGISAARDFVPERKPHMPGTGGDAAALYAIHITGPGLDTHLSLQDDSDLVIVQALLDKIRRHLQRNG